MKRSHFYASLVQAIGDMVSMALCPQACLKPLSTPGLPRTQLHHLISHSLDGVNDGGDVAQLVKRRPGTPLKQVRFPDAARDFFSQNQPSVQTLLRCPYRPRVQRMH